MRPRPLLGLALAATLAVGTTATAATAQTAAAPPEASSSDNFEVVAQIPGAGGTDLQFFSRDLSEFEAADGTMTSAPKVKGQKGPRTATRHFAMVGNQDSGAKIVDITDPEAPYTVADLGDQGCVVGQGDIQVTQDGMLASIAFQTDGGCTLADGTEATYGSILVDLSDPYAPVPVGNATDPDGAHNNTIHPSGDYLYISTSGITETTARVPVYDISDPTNPVLVTEFQAPGNSPHDIVFNDAGDRAYMAGISQNRIVDTSNPADPQLITTIVTPGESIGHDAVVSPDGAFLFLGDEGGGGLPYPCPGGAVYTYDIRDENVPILLGASYADVGPVTNNQTGELDGAGVGACTAHVMDLNPDGTSFTLGWYTAGTRTFDFSALYDANGEPRTLSAIAFGPTGTAVTQSGYIVPEDADTWSAKQYAPVPGYIFSDDQNLGLYVTRITDR